MHMMGQKKGFTMVETLVAITILITATIAPMTIAARGLQSAFYAREHMTAVYLAQEAIENIRSRRDSFAIANKGTAADDWTGMANIAKCISPKVCDIDVRDSVTDDLVDCTLESNCRLQYDGAATTTGARGMYTHTTVSGAIVNSPFTRIITMTPSAPFARGNNDIKIQVTVRWQAGVLGGVKSITLQSVILNAYDAL